MRGPLKTAKKRNDQTEQCVIYARYPHPTKSIADQLSELRLQAQRRGLQIVAVYTDSNHRIGRRGNPPGLVEILHRATTQKDFRYLLITDFGRLADIDAGISITRNYVTLADLGIETLVLDYPTFTPKTRLSAHAMFTLLRDAKLLTAPAPKRVTVKTPTWNRDQLKTMMLQGKTMRQIGAALRWPKWTTYRRMESVRAEL